MPRLSWIARANATARIMSRMTRKFVASIERFVADNDVLLIPFAKGERKDDVAQARYAEFDREEGVVFVGKAQAKASVSRAETRRHPESGQTYPWLVRSTAAVNHHHHHHYYFYCIDKDFGPFFLKFCSCFPCCVLGKNELELVDVPTDHLVSQRFEHVVRTGQADTCVAG